MQRTDRDVDAFLAALDGDRGEELRALDKAGRPSQSANRIRSLLIS
ncbi:MAG TPA: hypothetical protein VJ948_12305 [Acidimicrobiia bacterium]|nr:hypothetical protein [Acidimicrobiia bacterium]